MTEPIPDPTGSPSPAEQPSRAVPPQPIPEGGFSHPIKQGSLGSDREAAPEEEAAPVSEALVELPPPLWELSRRCSESDVEMTHIVMPNDTNPLGTVFGGRVMEWVDVAGGVAAQRHCRKPVVTAELDEMTFRHPIKVGHIAVLKAHVNFVANTSMEVGVKVLSEDPFTGERKHTSSAYLTYVAIDEDGERVRVPRLILETEEDTRRFKEGAERRRARLIKAGRLHP